MLLFWGFYWLLWVRNHNTILCMLHVLFLTSCSSIALYIKINHILYYHLNALRSTTLEHRYFISPDHLVLQGRIKIMPLSPTNILLVWPNIHQCIEFFSWVVEYFHSGVSCCPHHHIIVLLDVNIHFGVTTFPNP